MKSITFMFSLAVLSSCSRNESTTTTIDKERFEAAYVELLDSAAVSQPSASDSTVSPTVRRILQRRKITIQQFKASVAAYNNDTKKWKEFYENVVKKYDERSKRSFP